MTNHIDDDLGPAIPLVPVGLRVEGRPILVVGAGRIAARKASAYVDQGALVTVVAPEHGPEMAGVDVVDRVVRPFRPADLDGVWLVVTATGDPEVDGSVYEEAERRRIWCNAADDPGHCSVILPAVSRRHGLTIAITTGGRSPAVASWLRRRIDAMLDDDTITVARICSRLRATMRRHGLPTEVAGWAEVLDREALPLMAAGRPEELERRLLAATIGDRP